LRTAVVLLMCVACRGGAKPSAPDAARVEAGLEIVVDDAAAVSVPHTRLAAATKLGDLLPGVDPSTWRGIDAEATGRRAMHVVRPTELYRDQDATLYVGAGGQVCMAMVRRTDPAVPPTVEMCGIVVVRLRTKEHVAEPAAGHAVAVVAGEARGELTPAALAALPPVAAPRGGRSGDWRELSAALAARPAATGGRIELRGRDGEVLDATGGRVLLKVNRKGEVRARQWRGEAAAGEIADLATVVIYPR
jgi:hypothetical protein